MASNAVFISYRRAAAPYFSRAVYQHLVDAGIDAFYDIESIRVGRFDTIILNQIAARPYFLLVLTPGTLDRCVRPNDFLRREIEHAIGTGRHIVLAHSADFEFEDCERYLPGELGRELTRWNSQKVPGDFFTEAVRKIVDEYLIAIDDVELTPTPSADRADVQRVQARAEDAEPVTPTQLTAQQHFWRAYGHQEKGELDPAIAEYDRAIELDPDNAALYLNRGAVRSGRGDRTGAIADLDRAIELEPDNALAYSNRGLARRRTGDPKGAMADYDLAIEIDRNEVQAFCGRGHLRASQGDHVGAIADFDRAIELDPDDAFPHFGRGIARASLADLDGAIADFDRAIELDPDDAIVFGHRGMARARLGDVAGAMADFERGKQLAPNDPNFDRQIDRLRAPTRPVRDDPAELTQRSVVLHEEGRNEEALELADRVIELAPTRPEGHANRALYLKGLGRLGEALASIDRSLDLDASRALNHFNRGLILADLRRFDDAVVAYDHAIELDPRRAPYHYRRANTLGELGRYEEALQSIDRTLELDPSSEKAQRIKRRLQGLIHP